MHQTYFSAFFLPLDRYSTKIDSYSKKLLSNDLVRERLFKNNRDFISVKDSDKDKEEETSVFTDEDFKRCVSVKLSFVAFSLIVSMMI